MAHPMVAMAGRVGKTFQIDPVAILDNGGDRVRTLVRIAAARVVQDDERKAAEASKKGRRR